MKEHWYQRHWYLPVTGKPLHLFVFKRKTWKRIFNTNSELLQNCTEKQIMPSKTTINWLFNDIWSYLFIACFDWKIGVFQQKFVFYEKHKFTQGSLEFILYNGTSKETYVETRLGPYNEQKRKNLISLSLSCNQAIRRANYQSYYWLHCTDKTFSQLSLASNG